MRGTMRREVRTVLFLAAISTALASAPARAAIFTVDTLADGVDANLADNVCQSATGDCTLRAAIQQAETAPGPFPHKIYLPLLGTYTLDICCDFEDDGAEGDLDLNANLEIVGVSPANTVIQQTVSDRVFHCEPSSGFRSVALRNLSVTGGIFFNTSPPQHGGGLLFQNCHYTLDNVVVDGNLNSSGGFGCNIRSGNSDAVIWRSTITGGDGVCLGSALHLNNAATRTAVISQSLIVGNEGLGAAVYFVGPASDISINNSTLSDNLNFSNGPNLHLELLATATLNHVTLVQDNLNQPNIRLDDATVTTLTVRNSVIQQEAGADNCELNLGSILSLGYNIESSNSCQLTSLTDSVNTDAFLSLLADNGGPTLTHAFAGRSPAIDYIPIAGALPNLHCNGFGLLRDQRNAPRIGDCDAGAYEDMGCPVLVLSSDTIFSSNDYEECAITAGPDLTVTGDLLLTVGTVARFDNGFQVENGGYLQVEHDPALQFVLPELVVAERQRRAVKTPR